jgi:hypothetical protein
VWIPEKISIERISIEPIFYLITINFFLTNYYTMPGKKTRRGKQSKQQVGGWFWEDDDPIFGKSNQWIGRNVIKPISKVVNAANEGLKRTKILSTLARPIGNILGGPTAGAVAGNYLEQAGYGTRRRPRGKAPQHGSGATVYKTRSYPIRALPKAQMGGASPFMLTNNSSFNSVKF